MDEAGLTWWQARQQPCPNCGRPGVPILLDIQDLESKEAIGDGLASLGGCGLGGSKFDLHCLACDTKWVLAP